MRLPVSRYQCGWSPGGSGAWYRTSCGERFQYTHTSHKGDPVSFGHVGTSLRYSLFGYSTSRLPRLGPYCLHTTAAAPTTPPPGLCLRLIAMLDDRGCVRRCLCLRFGTSCRLPMSLPGYATPPMVFPVSPRIDFILPQSLISAGTVTDLAPRFALAVASRAICLLYTYPWCVVPSYIIALLVPTFLPLSKAIFFIVGCGWVGYRFELKSISYQEGLQVFLVCEFVHSMSGGSFFWVAHLWRLLVRGIHASGFSVVSTHSTERCFYLYSTRFTDWAGSEGFGQRDAGWTVLRAILST